MQNQISVQPVTATLTQGMASGSSQVVQPMPFDQTAVPYSQSATDIGQDMTPLGPFVQPIPYGTCTSTGLGSNTVSNVPKPTVPPNPNPNHTSSTSTNKFGTEKCVNMTDKIEASATTICREQNQAGNVDNSKISVMRETLSDKTNIPDKSLGSGSLSSTSRYSVRQIKVHSKSNCSRAASSAITTMPAQQVADVGTEKASIKVTVSCHQNPSGVALPSSGSSTKSVKFVDGISTEVLQYCRTQSFSTELNTNQRKTESKVPELPVSKNGQYSLNGRDPRYSRHLLDLVTTLALQNEVSDVFFVEIFETWI